MIGSHRVDGTNLLVIGGVLFVVGAGSWTYIGTFLVWAFWQVALYFLTLFVVSVGVYVLLLVVVAGEDERPSSRERIDESATE